MTRLGIARGCNGYHYTSMAQAYNGIAGLHEHGAGLQRYHYTSMAQAYNVSSMAQAYNGCNGYHYTSMAQAYNGIALQHAVSPDQRPCA